ncbi:hypothetical protein M8845_16190 [Gelidibacter japonicus]|jgi:hypothetical protein|uniref:hypothetical protein n=1 Tax=Gelidibacter japonicus TaxID=1962232 RepID=UPI002020CF8E|nr:hypothetical protein [Gelidibacter japonicus]MCL8008972.1 hypothetical protein [Gelidibacter japonicus]
MQLTGAYMHSSTLKGLVCHTSVDDSSTIGPDPIFGWGFLDAKASAESNLEAKSNAAIFHELNLVENETYSVTFSPRRAIS